MEWVACTHVVWVLNTWIHLWRSCKFFSITAIGSKRLSFVLKSTANSNDFALGCFQPCPSFLGFTGKIYFEGCPFLAFTNLSSANNFLFYRFRLFVLPISHRLAYSLTELPYSQIAVGGTDIWHLRPSKCGPYWSHSKIFGQVVFYWVSPSYCVPRSISFKLL